MINTIAEAAELRGTTWERDGKRRVVTRVVNLCAMYGKIYGSVYWRRPEGLERLLPSPVSNFDAWLSGATEVKTERQ